MAEGLKSNHFWMSEEKWENEKNNRIEQATTAEEWLRKAWEELYTLREKVSIFQDCVTFQIRKGCDLDG